MNRRQFLSTTASSLALSNLSLAQETSFRGKIKKAVKFEYHPNEEQMKKLKDLGFDGIEGSAPGLKSEAMKQACAKYRLPMHGVVYSKHWHTRLSDANPQVREKSREGLAQAIRDSHAAGGTSVLLVPGKVTGDNENHRYPGPFDRTDPSGGPAR